jgi:predicted Fe-Mo cluster-binding NifX family protein
MNASRKMIAIPLFGDRISPHFGSSSRFLLVIAEKQAILYEKLLSLKESDSMKQARQLVNLGVEEIICGGIQARFKDWLMRQGVVVVDNQKGKVWEVLEELIGRSAQEDQGGQKHGETKKT